MLEYVEQFVTTLVVALATAVVWLFRTVFTNQKEIALLKEEIKSRQEGESAVLETLARVRDEDRKILLELKADLKSELKETKDNMAYIRSELTQLWKLK